MLAVPCVALAWWWVVDDGGGLWLWWPFDGGVPYYPPVRPLTEPAAVYLVAC